MKRIICRWCGQGFIEPADGSIGCPKCGGPFIDQWSPAPKPKYDMVYYDMSGTVVKTNPYEGTASATYSLSPSMSLSLSPSPSPSEEIPKERKDRWKWWREHFWGIKE